MKPTELLGVILRATGLYCMAGVLIDLARILWFVAVGHSWEAGDTLSKASTGAALFTVYAMVLLFGSDRIVALVYRQGKPSPDQSR